MKKRILTGLIGGALLFVVLLLPAAMMLLRRMMKTKVILCKTIILMNSRLYQLHRPLMK